MPRPLGVFQSMAQIFAWEFDNFLESQEAPIALSLHSRLPPPAHLCAIKERTPRQTRKVQVHLVGKGHFSRNCLGLVPSQWAMSLSMGTLGGAAWGSDSPNKAVFNWPGREWQERRWGGGSQLDRKNWFRDSNPANPGEGAGCSAWALHPKSVAQ